MINQASQSTMLIENIGYTPTRAAKLIGVCTRTLYRAMETGELPYRMRRYKRGRVILGRDLVRFSQGL